MNRREFVSGAALASGAACVGSPSRSNSHQLPATGDRVNFTRDGLDLTPHEHASVLAGLVDDPGVDIDSYSRGGVVEQLEQQFARELGKECAVFVPTGTLANHLALRRLTRDRRGNRVVVQAQSHIYRDSGDCAQELSGLHLLPLGANEPTFTAEEFERAIAGTAAGRVATKIAAVSIESPVRRRFDRRFDPDELRRVLAVAEENGIATHLDGARLHIESAFSGVSVASLARPFDTVYVSLYKAFHSGSGAVLAGPRELLQGLYHERRMFGGGMPQVWQYAAVALSFLPGTVERLQRAIVRADELFALLERQGFTFERLEHGTNVVFMRAPKDAAATLVERARKHDVTLPKAMGDGVFALKINESLLRRTAVDLAAAFAG